MAGFKLMARVINIWMNKKLLILFQQQKMEEHDEEEDTDENTGHLTQKEKCLVPQAEAMRMFDHCLTWLHFQSEASVSNTSTLV